MLPQISDEIQDSENDKFWHKLADFPHQYCGKPLHINEEEIINTSYQSPGDTDGGVFKYDTNKNDWTKLISYPHDLRSISHAVTINESKTKIYIYNQQASLIKINLKSKKVKVIKNLVQVGYGVAAIMINDEFHIVGGGGNKSHYIWNEEEQEFDHQHDFGEYMRGGALIHLKSKNVMLFVSTKGIYSYSLEKKIWTKLTNMNMEIPDIWSFYGHIKTVNETVITFGGYTSGYSKCNDIYSLDIDDDMTVNIKQCKLKCPTSGVNRACIGHQLGDIQKHLLTNGYIRKIWSLHDFGDTLFPSNDIIQLISAWYDFNTDIHMFGIDNFSSRTASHYSININDILSNF